MEQVATNTESASSTERSNYLTIDLAHTAFIGVQTTVKDESIGIIREGVVADIMSAMTEWVNNGRSN